MFLADGLARFGIEADFVQVSPYKSAADVLTKSKMSDELREQVTLAARLAAQGAAERHRRIARGSTRPAPRSSSTARRTATTSRSRSTRSTASSPRRTCPTIWPAARQARHASGPGSARSRKLRTPAPTLRRGKYVALLRIEGTIIDGRSGRLPVKPPIDVPLVGDDRAGDLSVVQLARQVAADKRAAAAVLYVNSRGGSSTASEAMRQALAVIAERKPLVVVMGPVAASGGYWVSTPGIGGSSPGPARSPARSACSAERS